jgi:hypothetical protein
MTSRRVSFATVVCTLAVTTAPALTGAPRPAARATDVNALTRQYCAGCHNDRVSSAATAAGVSFDRLDATRIADARDAWEKVVRKLRNGSMPPAGMPRPDEATTTAVRQQLEGALDRIEADSPDPGRPLLRRLNRAEYANAIRDLLALEIDPSSLLPPDDSAFGFDTIGDALGVSPALIERYLSAADRVSELAVGDPTIGAGATTYRVPHDRSQDQHIEGLPFGTVGGLAIRHTFPLDAAYEFQVKLFRTNLEMMRGLEYPHQLDVLVDDEVVFSTHIGGPADLELARKYTDGADEIDARLRVRVPVKAGPHAIGVTFQRKIGVGASRLQHPLRSSADTFEATGRPHIELVTIRGPFGATGPGDTPSRRKIFDCRPLEPASGRAPAKADATARACARQIVARLSRQAFRRPVTAADIDPILEFYDRGRAKGDFDTGIQMALRRMLASPSFVFREERDSSPAPAGRAHRVSDIELASRLSFFLWSSLPDEELLSLAEHQRLHEPAILEAQVKRMLAHPRGRALVTNFAGQWLQLRNLRNARPNSFDFPDFDDNLRQGLLRETELFADSIIRGDRNAIELLTADYTFVNERVARHYRMTGVSGSQFRRVHVADEARRGLLGQGSILLVTSHADRTSPVVRGKWILENLMGSPPPPPPPDVPALKDDEEGAPPTSMRARMEQHRRNPVCASCHQIMDPIGLSLENFDAVGAWRALDGGAPIDATTRLGDGTVIDGPVALRRALLKRPEVFVATVTEKLMIYALGRGLSYHDLPAVRAIVNSAAGQDYRFSSLILGVVRSVPFQMRSTE